MSKNNYLRHALCALMLLAGLSSLSAREFETTPVRKYYEMMKEVKTGWNTWDVRSMFTQMYLPQSYAIKVALVDSEGNCADDMRVGNTRDDAALVHPYQHTFDGAYSEVDATWHGASVKLRSTSDGDRLVMLVTPLKSAEGIRIRVKPEYAWDHFSSVSNTQRIKYMDKDTGTDFHFYSRDRKFNMQGNVSGTDKEFVDGAFFLDASHPVLIYTGDPLTEAEADRLLEASKQKFTEQNKALYDDRYDMFNAMQSILAWDTIYDPSDDIVVSPVSRNWCLRWALVEDFGGYMLFDWDTFLASQMMAACGCRELAYSNAMEVLQSVDHLGFVPKWRADHTNFSADCSQPPLGSMSVWRIYQQFHEKWFLELAYDRLMTWNLWWPKERLTDGLFCWGSNRVPLRWGEPFTGSTNNAILESGLDNSPMYDDAELNPENNQLNLQDVGLTSLYVMDCDYLALIAKELGRKDDARALTKRADMYRKSIQRFWCEEDGMFYNIDTRTGKFNKVTSCTNFYVLLAKAATKEQAQRIVDGHLMNTDEFWGEWVIPMTPRNIPAFNEQNYWRGRIWGPTNYLVYMGLRNYDFPETRRQMAEKSGKLLMKDWLTNGCIYENWNAKTGEGNDASNSDWFYHWGALLGYIPFMEKE